MADIFIHNIQTKPTQFNGINVMLSKRQLENCLYEINTKRHWTEKVKHIIGRINSYIQGSGLKLDETTIKDFIEVYLPLEQQRHNVEFMKKSKAGIIKNKFTPTDINGGFGKVEIPKVGNKYHLSWASKGAVFVLKRIDGDKGYVDNPKYKRAIPLKINLSDLRKLAER